MTIFAIKFSKFYFLNNAKTLNNLHSADIEEDF